MSPLPLTLRYMSEAAGREMGGLPDQVCALCGRRSRLISATLSVCGECVRADPDAALSITCAVHAETRHPFSLPAAPPQTAGGVRCPLCARECLIGEGERGFCGLRTVRNGRLVHLAHTP